MAFLGVLLGQEVPDPILQGTFQKHLHAAGLADSPVCAFCQQGVVEDAPHVYWHCPAWAVTRREDVSIF